jgi:hypothetical protein
MSTLQTPTPRIPRAAEIDKHLVLAAQGIVTLDGLDDDRWEALLIGVLKRGVVTPADRRAAKALRKLITDELKAA